jgi:hypothetical protein
VKWATAIFGTNDDLTKLRKSEQKWIAELIKARNAVEHPGGHSGALTINNIRADPNNPGAFIPPTWQRTGCPESNILADMDTELHNMLTLAEDLLVDLIKRKSKFAALIEFVEIPVKDRDPQCPIRLRVVPKREIQALTAARQLTHRKLTAAQRKEQQIQYKARAGEAKKLLILESRIAHGEKGKSVRHEPSAVDG